ncbi:hypothetical protein C834K_0607 [Chlamydia poikilotherma]|uniref:Uncharacterized protein n=2 Tax=Chlamydia poikilotherma TaxID=1967783 RepID=A0A3B0PSU6_9CHLA|nr:hypothetical protein C834K_0607 [Chlamydia poikilotherma]
MTLPLANAQSSQLDYTLLSSNDKLSLYSGIHSHRCKGSPLVIIATIIFVCSIILLLIGSLLAGYPCEGFSFVSDIFLPFLLPGILSFVLISAPLIMYAFQHHKGALSKHKQLAESNYLQILNYCNSQRGKFTKKEVAEFVESEVLLREYPKRFSYVTLLQTIKVIPHKDSPHTSIHDTVIAEGIDRARDDIYASEYDKEKRNRIEAEEEEDQAAEAQQREVTSGISSALT